MFRSLGCPALDFVSCMQQKGRFACSGVARDWEPAHLVNIGFYPWPDRGGKVAPEIGPKIGPVGKIQANREEKQSSILGPISELFCPISGLKARNPFLQGRQVPKFKPEVPLPEQPVPKTARNQTPVVDMRICQMRPLQPTTTTGPSQVFSWDKALRLGAAPPCWRRRPRCQPPAWRWRGNIINTTKWQRREEQNVINKGTLNSTW